MDHLIFTVNTDLLIGVPTHVFAFGGGSLALSWLMVAASGTCTYIVADWMVASIVVVSLLICTAIVAAGVFLFQK